MIIELLFYLCKIFGHPNYSRHNAKKFLELTESNLFLVFFFCAFLIVLSSVMSTKKKREEIAIAQECFNKRTIVIESGVIKPDIRVAPFDFI
jgi:hypothetical protein